MTCQLALKNNDEQHVSEEFYNTNKNKTGTNKRESLMHKTR